MSFGPQHKGFGLFLIIDPPLQVVGLEQRSFLSGGPIGGGGGGGGGLICQTQLCIEFLE